MPVKEDTTELAVEIAELRGHIREAEQKAGIKREAAEQLKAEIKAAGVNPITGTSADDKDAFKRIDEAYRESDELFELAAEYRRRMTRLVDHASSDALADGDTDDSERPAARRGMRLARFGERFLASESYRQLRRSGALEMSQAAVKTAPVQVATREEAVATLFGRTHLAAQLDGGPLTPTDQQLVPPVEFPVRPLRVRDLITVNDTDTDTIEYVEETTRTDAAAETAYGTAAPEATYVYTVRTVAVKRIPHALPATKGNLADQGQLRGLIDSRLMYGVGKRVDTQMVSGDGVGENMRGILNTAGIGSQAQGTDSKSDAFHKSMTVVRIALEDEPDGFLVHPDPYQEWALEKGTDGHYLTKNGPQSATPLTIWGKPAVINTVVGTTVGLVGNFRVGATLWVRTGVSVAASDSHADFFTKGLVMLLAEMRAGFAAVQPKAFCQVTGL
ncbi:MAG: phage major capsid protein [Acidimicrobiales bacterium]